MCRIGPGITTWDSLSEAVYFFSLLITRAHLSRFGRNHLHVGIYTTEFFPKHNVRFIAINDNVDTFTTDMETDISIPIKNIINEIYAVDTSRKIKAVYRAKGLEGKHTDFQNELIYFALQKWLPAIFA